MKKLALTVAIVAAIGVAACTKKSNDEGNTAATDVNATTEQAVTDVNAATTATDNSLAGAENSAAAADNSAAATSATTNAQ